MLQRNVSRNNFSLLNELPSVLPGSDINDITYLRPESSSTNIPTLYRDGCQNKCNVTCDNVDTIFSSLSAFSNCLFYSAVSDWVSSPNASEGDVDIASRYAIQELPIRPVDKIIECILGYQDWCKANPGCLAYKSVQESCAPLRDRKGNESFFALNVIHRDYSDSWMMSYCLNDICKSQEALINSDLGGVGVCGFTVEAP